MGVSAEVCRDVIQKGFGNPFKLLGDEEKGIEHIGIRLIVARTQQSTKTRQELPTNTLCDTITFSAFQSCGRTHE